MVLLMYLTKEEEKMLDGEYGPAVQYAMKLLTKFGDVFGAERMVKIVHAHVSCTTYSIEYALVDWLDDLVKMGARVRVPTTGMITNIDLELWRELGIPEEWYKNTRRLIDHHIKMGFIREFTCTPYFVPGLFLSKGDHVAWCESSAIIFGNSVMGIRTNRECCQSALMAAIAGRTPEFGFHLIENRRGVVLVKVKTKLKSVTDFSLMGYHLAEDMGLRTPVFDGIPHATVEQMDNLAAAFTTRSGISMFHIVGVTPEAPTLDAAFQGDKPEDTIDFTQADLLNLYKRFREAEVPIQRVYIGCPHLNLKQVAEVARLINGKKVAKGVTFLVGTTRAVKRAAEEAGYADIIRKAGGYLISDTCGTAMRHSIGYPWGEPENWVFNGMKQVYYFKPGRGFIGDIKECVEAAITGKWRVIKDENSKR